MNNINALFKTDNLTDSQLNYLKCIMAIPKVNEVFGKKILPAHIKGAEDAQEIIDRQK